MAFLNPPPGIDDYRFAIVELLDARARERRDGNAVSIATYVGSTNPQWVAVAAAYVPWRDAVWAYAYAELDKVMAASTRFRRSRRSLPSCRRSSGRHTAGTIPSHTTAAMTAVQMSRAVSLAVMAAAMPTP